MDIAGSSALVVGGAGGLGEATVRRLHAAGAKVVVADLADEKGPKLAEDDVIHRGAVESGGHRRDHVVGQHVGVGIAQCALLGGADRCAHCGDDDCLRHRNCPFHAGMRMLFSQPESASCKKEK